MENGMNWAREGAIQLLRDWGNWAVAPALLVDQTGIPWLWIFVMLLAEKAGRNVLLLLLLGMAVVTAFDHALYWIGAWGGRPLVGKIGNRFPRFAAAIVQAENAVRGRGVWTLVAGRFLPILGRWVGLAAGLVQLPYARFTFYNAIGSGITVVGFGLLAHFVGEKTVDQPWFGRALGLLFIGGMALMAVLVLAGWWRSRRAQSA